MCHPLLQVCHAASEVPRKRHRDCIASCLFAIDSQGGAGASGLKAGGGRRSCCSCHHAWLGTRGALDAKGTTRSEQRVAARAGRDLFTCTPSSVARRRVVRAANRKLARSARPSTNGHWTTPNLRASQ